MDTLYEKLKNALYLEKQTLGEFLNNFHILIKEFSILIIITQTILKKRNNLIFLVLLNARNFSNNHHFEVPRGERGI